VGGCTERQYSFTVIITGGGGTRKFIALKVPTQCPLVLVVEYAGNKVKRWEVKKA
jgi:hypothetical protein